MKLLKRVFERDGSGWIELVPEEPEDMWHAYHLLAEGDILRSTTIRYFDRGRIMQRLFIMRLTHLSPLRI